MFNKITLKLNNNKHISQFYARSILVNKRREVFKMLPVLPFLVGGALAELKSQAPTVKTVIPLTSKGLTQENLDELASILSKGN